MTIRFPYFSLYRQPIGLFPLVQKLSRDIPYLPPLFLTEEGKFHPN